MQKYRRSNKDVKIPENNQVYRSEKATRLVDEKIARSLRVGTDDGDLLMEGRGKKLEPEGGAPGFINSQQAATKSGSRPADARIM